MNKRKVLEFYANKQCKFCDASMADHAYPSQLCKQAREIADRLLRSNVRGKALRAAFTANVVKMPKIERAI